MFHFYSLHRAEFLQHYHKRSNIETTFHMIKSKFGQRLRSNASLVALWVAIRPVPPPSASEIAAQAIARELPTDLSSSGSASVPNAGISPTKKSTPGLRAFLDVEPEKLCAFFDRYNFAQAQDLIKPYLGKWMDADGTVLEVRYETFYASAGDPSRTGITVWIESTRIYKGTGIAVFAMFDDPQGIERAKVLKNKERIKVRGQIQSVRAYLFSLQHSWLGTIPHVAPASEL